MNIKLLSTKYGFVKMSVIVRKTLIYYVGLFLRILKNNSEDTDDVS